MAFEHFKDVATSVDEASAPTVPVEEKAETQSVVEPSAAGDHKPFDAGPLLPWFVEDGSPHSPHVLGFGNTALGSASPTAQTVLPLANQDDLQARAARMQAEELLKSKRLQTGEDAARAVDILNNTPESERAKVIDQLDPKSFENLLDRVPEAEREKIEGLVDASQDPKRKVRMWAVVHKARATNDLQKYRQDFGAPDEDQTHEQRLAEAAYDRRERGVESDAAEIDAECAAMLAKAEAGKLTVKDVDDVRERKDLELDVEMQNNVNLITESTPRDDGSAVRWTKGDLLNSQTALSQVPGAHKTDPRMAETFVRRATRGITSPRAEYRGGDDAIDVYDSAEGSAFQARTVPERSLKSPDFVEQHGEQVNPLEYSLTHEIGHNVAAENKEAFTKFQNAANWRDNLRAAELGASGVPDVDVAKLEAMRRGAVGDRSLVRGDTVYSPGNWAEHGKYASVDATAVPDSPHMTYARTNSGEHFAEMYAQAVLTPEALYDDYVATPTAALESARNNDIQKREHLASLERSGVAPDAVIALEKLQLASADVQLHTREKAQRQQATEFSIMRNDVFGTDKAQQAAEARMRAAGIAPERIAEFTEQAPHASTPQQIEELERRAKAPTR